jgi:hypothetical protein
MPPGSKGVLLAGAILALLGPDRPAAEDVKGGLVPLEVSHEKLAQAHAPRRLALVVGVQRFDDPAWRPLRFPDADAEALAAVLEDPARGGFDVVERLEHGPTRDELRAALRRLGELDRDERDTVVVYLSTHGTLARDAVGQLRRYLVLRDSRMSDITGTALPVDELKADFDRLRSRRKVLVLAACHSGSGKSLLPEAVQEQLAGIKAGFFVRPIEEVSRASVVLAASDWGETAREDEKLGNDIYTHFLVEALRLGVDRNGDGATTVSEAHDYARRMTYEYTHGEQRPTAESNEVGADPIVLVGKVSRKGKPELYSYSARLDGFTVRVDGKPLAELPGGVALDPGRHRVQLAKGTGPTILDDAVVVGAGERLEIEDLVLRQASDRWEVAPRVGVLSFLDARGRRDVLGPRPAFGASLIYSDWPARGMALALDVASSSGTARQVQGSQSASFSYAAVTSGVALPWRFTPDFLRGGALLAGPRLSAVWLQRRFGLDLTPGVQSYLTFTPGLLLGASAPVGRRITLGGELHLDWMLVRVNGQNRSSGFGELLLGAGYRF